MAKELSLLPEGYKKVVREAFFLQVSKDNAEELFDTKKKEILQSMLESERFAIGESFTTDEGTVSITTRASYTWDTKTIVGLVDKGDIDLLTLLNSVSFTEAKMREAFGDKIMQKICTSKEGGTPGLTLKQSKEFKESLNGTKSSLSEQINIIQELKSIDKKIEKEVEEEKPVFPPKSIKKAIAGKEVKFERKERVKKDHKLDDLLK